MNEVRESENFFTIQELREQYGIECKGFGGMRCPKNGFGFGGRENCLKE